MAIGVSLLNLVVKEYFNRQLTEIVKLRKTKICATRRKMMAKSQKTARKVCF